ncbi:MAG: SWIM zinc finger family protein [Anaerolineae bacterium]|jgi:uncharacterized Zn finger protein|nr:SWIM zinc finger family protein [Anaerolineae bacterium]
MAKRRSESYEGYWYRYEPTEPIEVEGGIKARSQGHKFVKNWWANRWIAALTPLMDSGRLSRGRSYARKGQVMDIEVEPGVVVSRVQGTRPRPYNVKIRLKPLSDRQWEKVLDALAGQAIFAAQLLNGEMPPDVEEVFQAVSVPLFPDNRGDLVTSCSCPDSANPCKHIAAVYYLLGERFDEDPFLLFELRGRNQDAVTAALRQRRAAEAGPVEAAYGATAVAPVDAPSLDEDLERFWAMGEAAANLPLAISRPTPPFALLKRVGLPAFPGLAAGGFQRQMERVYDSVTEAALAAAFADTTAMGWDGEDNGERGDD